MCPSKVGKGVLVSPTSSFNYIVGPSAEVSEETDTSCDTKTYSFLREKAKNLVQNIPYQETIKGFAGVRANNDRNDFIIEESEENKLFFNVSGIMSPGLASSPAIGEFVANDVAAKLNLTKNVNFKATNRPHKGLHWMSSEAYDKLVKEDATFANYVCRCEKVSEGDIIDIIHRNCGATTIKGVRKRTRSGFGKCQGTFCQTRVVNILARELNKDPKEILFSEIGTNVLIEESKGAK